MTSDSISPHPIYGLLVLAGIAVSATLWARLARRDPRLLAVYLGGLAGAFLGAKLLYLLIDGWRFLGREDLWLQLATGKTILGALFGGYAGVELAKKLIGYRPITGDAFALIAPAGIALGRLGCWAHGCCQGQPMTTGWFTLTDAAGVSRWPAVPLEIGFNLAMLALFLALRRARRLPGQHFHLYLIAYGAFRCLHEFRRSEHRLIGPLTGYHLAAAALLLFGILAFHRRARDSSTPIPCP